MADTTNTMANTNASPGPLSAGEAQARDASQDVIEFQPSNYSMLPNDHYLGQNPDYNTTTLK